MEMFLPLLFNHTILDIASLMLIVGSLLILYKDRFLGSIVFLISFFFLFSWYVISLLEMVILDIIVVLYIAYLIGALFWLQPYIHKLLINIEFYFLAFRYKIRKI